jgi:hypothetical protein
MRMTPTLLPFCFLLFLIQDIDGKDTQMSKFQGKVCLVVNLASKCGPSWPWPGWWLCEYVCEPHMMCWWCHPQLSCVLCAAGACGFTPQYSELQGLYNKYSSKGLVVLGFPCNQVNPQQLQAGQATLCHATPVKAQDKIEACTQAGDQGRLTGLAGHMLT